MSQSEAISKDVFEAIGKGKIEEVRATLDSVGIRYSNDWKEGYVLLRESVRYRQYEIAKLLLNYEIKLNMEMPEQSDTPLHFAVRNKNIEIVELFLRKGAHVDAKNHFNKSPLHLAVENNNLHIVKSLVQYGANVNCKDREGMTPLHLAAREGFSLITQYLLNEGASVISTNIDGLSPLHLAILQGLEDHAHKFNRDLTAHSNISELENIVSSILEYGADVNAKSKYNKTPLLLAVETGFFVVVKSILNYGPDCHDKNNKDALYLAISDGRQKYRTIVKELLKYGFSFIPEDVNNARLLFDCVRGGHIEALEELIKHGADINISIAEFDVTKGNNLIHCAAGYGHLEIIELLIKNGSDVNAMDKHEQTALHYAIEARKFDVTKLLLQNNATVFDNFGLLYLAITNGRDDIVCLLLEYITEESIAGQDIKALIYCSVFRGNAKITKLLLDKGAWVNAKYEAGETLLHVAVEKQYEEVVSVLLEYNADINARRSGFLPTPLHISTLIIQRTYFLELLLEYGADINVTNLLEEIAYDVPWSDNFFSDEHIKFLREHVVKMKVAGLSSGIKNLEKTYFFSEKFSGYGFLQTACEREIERMKFEKLGNSNVTYYDILTNHNNKLATYVTNTGLFEVLKLGDYETQFPIYSNIIRGKYKRGIQRKELLKKANKFMNNFPKLPFYCIEIIASFLNNADLHNLIDAIKTC